MRTAIFVLLASLAAPVAAAPKPKMVVLDLVAERGIEDAVVRLLNELLLTEFAKSRQYEILGGSDVRAILDVESQKAVMGCDDATCLAEIGGALGADFLAASNIGRIGDYYLLNVKILDVRSARVVKRWSEQVEGLENKLMAAVRTTVAAVGEEEPGGSEDNKTSETIVALSVPTETETEAVAESEASSLHTPGLLPITLWAAGGAAIITGVIFGVKAKSHFDNASNPDFDGGAHELEPGRTAQVVANVSYGVGGAALAAGVLTWLLLGDDEAATVALAPTFGPAGTGLALHLSL